MPSSAEIRFNRHHRRFRRVAGPANDRGVALVGVLLLTAAILALGIFGAQGAQVELRIAGNDLRSEQALALAEAGAHHALALIKNAGNTSFDTEIADGTDGALTNLGSIVAVRGYNYRFRRVGLQADDGYYVRMADNFDETSGANDPTRDQDLKVSIISRGLVGNAERVVSIGLQGSYAFPYAFFGEEHIKLGGGMIVDSFDSRIAPYDPATSGEMGNVRSNGDIEVNAIVNGDVTASGSVDISNGSTVTGKVTDGAPKLDFPSVPPCGPPYSDGTGIVGNGKYRYNSVTGELTLTGTVTLAEGKYCFSSVKESSKGLLEIDGPVEIYVTGAIDLTGQGINNKNPIAANLLLFSSYADSGSGIKLRAQVNTYVAAYAPDTCLTTSGGADFFGSMIARCIDSTGGSGLHYDEALGADITVGAPKLVSWTEERNF